MAYAAPAAFTTEDRERVIDEAALKFGFAMAPGGHGDSRLVQIRDRVSLLLTINRWISEQQLCQTPMLYRYNQL